MSEAPLAGAVDFDHIESRQPPSQARHQPGAHPLGPPGLQHARAERIVAQRGQIVDAHPQPGEVHGGVERIAPEAERSEEHTSELQSLMRITYAVFCLKKKKIN